MKYLAKLVTGILVMVFLTTPVLAAVPCRPAAHTMACCGGAACPMMATASGGKTAPHTGTKGAPTHCCKLTIQFPVAVAPQKAPEMPFSTVVLRADLGAFFASVVQVQDKNLALIDPRSRRRPQAVLCSFLI